MSKILQLGAEVVENQQTNKYRVMVQMYRDDVIDFKIILNAAEAHKLGSDLITLAADCRKKEPEGGGFLQTWKGKIWQRKKKIKAEKVLNDNSRFSKG